MSLPEVQRANAYIDSFSNHKHGISFLIQRYPGKGVDHYWVQAGYNGDLHYEPYFNFYVYPPELAVKILDPLTGSVYTLVQWRIRKKRFGWDN